jgi:hypothetical protein
MIGPFDAGTGLCGLFITVILGLALLDVNTQLVTHSLYSSLGQIWNICFNEKPVTFSSTNSGDDWSTQIQKSLFGFIVGIFLLIFSVLFSFGIERFAVKFSFVIGRAKRACVPNVTSERINKNLNCRMIHVTGPMSVEASASDDELGYTPSRSAVVLKRRVELLQWHEHKHKHEETRDGHKHVTYSYSYTLGWTEHDIDSADFHEHDGHVNPPRAIPIKTQTFYAETHVGAYRISAEQIQKLKRFHVSELTPEAASKVTPKLLKPPQGYTYVGLRDGSCSTRVEGQATARGETYWSSLYDEYSVLPRKFIYVARNAGAEGPADHATAGDLRICYDAVHEGPISLAGVLQYDSFRAFNERDAHTTNGRLAEQLLPGGGGAEGDALAGGGCCGGCCGGFCDEDTKFHTRLALLRAAAAALLWLALALVLGPVSTLLSFLPLVGGLLQGLFAVAALLLAALLWLSVVAVAWFSSHPYGLAALLLVEVMPHTDTQPTPPAPTPRALAQSATYAHAARRDALGGRYPPCGDRPLRGQAAR